MRGMDCVLGSHTAKKERPAARALMMSSIATEGALITSRVVVKVVIIDIASCTALCNATIYVSLNEWYQTPQTRETVPIVLTCATFIDKLV